MVERSKTLWLLIAAQTACLAVGLGVHYLYVTATISSDAEELARQELIREGQPLVSALIMPGQNGSPADVMDVIRDQVLPESTSITLTDQNWKVLVSKRSAAETDSEGKFIGATLHQTQWLDRFDRGVFPVRGQVFFPDGRHVAVAYALDHGEQFLIFHRPAAGIGVTLGTMTPSLLVGAAITLVWTCGLLGVAVYVIVSHHQQKATRSRIAPEVDALKRAQALLRTQETIIFGLAKLSDSRDGDTGDHLERISFYCSTLATALRQHPRYRDVVTPGFVQLIGISSALHDIGKVGVEDAILRKPGLLTKSEFDRMKCHTTIGEDCLKEIERRLGTSNFLTMAREIASFHHERWDGKGYPYGLRGEQIPLAARITAIADVYDALSSKRVYKDAYPHEKCVEIIREDAGKHFDPALVEVFLQVESSFRSIGRRFGPQQTEADELDTAVEAHHRADERAELTVSVN